MPIGAKVTLRGDRMWEFLDRLLSIALPRIRDFRGLSPKQFDGNGNYTFGLTEQSMFHEIDPDTIDRPRGMDITVVTTATNDDEGRALLKHARLPVQGELSEWRRRHWSTRRRASPKFAVRGYTRCQRCGRPRSVLPQVRPVPNLPARDGARGRAARRDQGFLVSRDLREHASPVTPIEGGSTALCGQRGARETCSAARRRIRTARRAPTAPITGVARLPGRREPGEKGRPS